MREPEIKYWQEKEELFWWIYINTKELLNWLNPILNPEATTKHASTSRPPCYAIPIWYFLYLLLLSLCHYLSVSLPLSIFVSLTCAIWRLIESCESQVGVGCRLLPTGIRRWRASAKTTANIARDSLCTHRCLNQREARMYVCMRTQAHKKETELFFNM